MFQNLQIFNVRDAYIKLLYLIIEESEAFRNQNILL
jgi:hypothetical protein